VAEVTEALLAILEERGVVMVREDIPGLTDLIGQNFATDMFCSMFEDISDYLSSHDLGIDYFQLTESIVTPQVASFMRLGLPGVFSEEDCTRALSDTRPKAQAMFSRYFEEKAVDAIVLPTVIFPAPPVGAQTIEIKGEELDVLSWTLRNVEPAAFAGLPSLSIPVGLAEETGMPVALMVDGPAGGDRNVLSIGKAIEGVLPEMPLPEIE
jgi:mandelamide amidase